MLVTDILQTSEKRECWRISDVMKQGQKSVSNSAGALLE